MDHDVLKLYSGITNVILKVSAHQPPSGKSGDRKDSVLLGSHIDSTLPSPGAAEYVGCESQGARLTFK